MRTKRHRYRADRPPGAAVLPLFLAFSRALALFLGGFSLLNLAGELRFPGFDANHWWIDFRLSSINVCQCQCNVNYNRIMKGQHLYYLLAGRRVDRYEIRLKAVIIHVKIITRILLNEKKCLKSSTCLCVYCTGQ